MISIAAKDHLIVALDVPDTRHAKRIVEELADEVTFYKVGMELVYSEGLDFVAWLVKAKKSVFLDLKLHDIPNTVERSVARLADIGATFLTVHAYPQTMAAALRGSQGSALKILGVSVLTSMNETDLHDAGYALPIEQLVLKRAQQAADIGIHGLVSSASELVGLRQAIGQKLVLVTPGIRPIGSETDDQKRIATPHSAINAGANHLVIGRPIVAAQDRRKAAAAIQAEIALAVQ